MNNEEISKDPKVENPTPKRKGGKFLKVLLILFCVFVLLFAIGATVFCMTFDSALRKTVEIVIPKVTQCKTTVGSIRTSFLHGSITINDLAIANPEGFKTDTVINVGTVHIDVDMSTLLKDKIVIEEVLIDKLQCTYEMMNLKESNITKLKDNVNAFLPQKTEEEKQAAEQKKQEALAKAKAEAEARGEVYEEPKGIKVQIDKVNVNNGKVRVSAVILSGSSVTLVLPDFEIKDIGKDKDETLAEAASDILMAILDSTSEVGSNYISKLGDKVKVNGTSVEKISDAIKGLFGKKKSSDSGK